MIGKIVLTSALACALSGVAVAQTMPATTAPASAVYALRGAYRAIADAQLLGSSPYLDAAKTHYRGALERYQRQDAGAASEAMAATALARAAVAEHPAPAPRDLPPPPADIAQTTPARDGGMMRPGMHAWMGEHGRMGGRRGWRFDAARLASDVKLAGTAEARDLGQKAIDADVARTRASFGGNADEAMRQGRLAGDLAMAVRALAYADHPPAFDRSRRPQGGRPRSGSSAGVSTLGTTSD
jgi:hypothetical protein